ncbi:PrsW family intramembrane metalloprotease [bacterium]|jgi:RsiW-degrading membrane proteinase PrsW (M82 family)|nr:PrsW family intramembrane metalloprotease [bacterium]MBT6831742.1 PrsW family intramembrane metalloprotease [bacterium]MBT6996565.1 PrsW family intramembrane metalloprotease [bacterium]MBT7772891.1 PrsW family intramembrane metalloprotease [bacterium]
MWNSILADEYFWLSFFPIAFLGGGFWLLFFDRADRVREPLRFLSLALVAGILSAVAYGFFAEIIGLENFFGRVAVEEVFKVFFALLAMELVRSRFRFISQGIMYGFAVGLGFAVAENIVFLAKVHELAAFSPEFWLTFQGRFWSSSLLHAITTGFFGLLYAGAYLSPTLFRTKKESPLRAFFFPPNFRQLWFAFSLRVTRKNLVFQLRKNLHDHSARAVILEGLWFAILLHAAFNFALEKSFPALAFLIAFLGMLGLWRISKKIS